MDRRAQGKRLVMTGSAVVDRKSRSPGPQLLPWSKEHCNKGEATVLGLLGLTLELG